MTTVLLVYGIHTDVYSALKALGKPTNFMPIPTIFLRKNEGLTENDLKSDRILVLTTPSPGERGRIWDLIEKAVEQAKEAGKDIIVIEAVWDVPFKRYARIADLIYVNGRLFEVRKTDGERESHE